MEFDPVDYPGQRAPIDPAAPRRDLWTYGDLAKFVLFSLAAQIVCFIFAIFAIPILFSVAERYLGVGYDVKTVEAYVLVVVTAVSAVLSLAYVYYVVAIRYQLPFWEALGFTPFRRRMYWFLLLGAVISVVEGLVGVLIGVPEDTPFAEMLSDRGTYLLMGALAIFIAPLFEEVLFRGFLYRPLERSWGPWGAIAVTSVIFSLLHGSQYAWSWQILLLLTLAGVWLGVARWKTGSFWPPILLHGGANAVSVVAFGVESFA
ncbi:MAG: type II CAAX endopeptidase family protein [Acidobacteria bacterium]|nr:type II CAAX endopeptidase family protein [Acidobacteriota bacterium]MDA1237189.1 type II CAAX endopeptidase family protein [Acidobacteriota bacterium]